MKKILLLALLVFALNAQESEIDKLITEWKNTRDGKAKVKITKKLMELGKEGQITLADLLGSQTRGSRVARKAGRSKDFAVTRKTPGYRQRHALIIGIDNYTGPGIQDLDGPGFDAAEVASVLALRYGFEKITLLADKTPDRSIPLPKDQVSNIIVSEVNRKTIIDALQNIKASDEDALLLYYAGHGMPGHIVASDSDVDKPETMISFKEIAQFLAMRHAHHTLMVLDCCYSGSILNEKYGVREVIDLPEPKLHIAGKDNFLRVFNRRSFQIITAGAGDEEVGDIVKSGAYLAKERDRGHSPFTAVLLNALRGLTGRADGKQIASELGFYLSYTLINEKGFENEKQAPRYLSLAGDGDFTFFPAYKVLNPKLVTPLYMTGKAYADLRASSCEALLRFINKQIVREQEALSRSAISHVMRLLDLNEEKKARLQALEFIEKLSKYYGKNQEFGQIIQPLAQIFIKHKDERNAVAVCLGNLYHHARADSKIVKLLEQYAGELREIWEKGKGDSLPDDQELRQHLAFLDNKLPSDATIKERVRYWGEQQKNGYWLATEGLIRVRNHREKLKIAREKSIAALKRSDETLEREEWNKCGAYAGFAMEKIKNMPGTKDLQNHARDNFLFALRRHPVIWENFTKKRTKTSSFDNDFGQWKTFLYRAENTYKNSSPNISCLRLHPREKIIAYAYKNTIILRKLSDGNVLRVFSGHSKAILAFCFSPDGRKILSSSNDQIILWNTDNGKILRSIANHKAKSIDISPDGKQFILSSSKNTSLWEFETCRKIQNLAIASIYLAKFSPDRKILALVSKKQIYLWHLKQKQIISVFKGNISRISNICFSSDGFILASAFEDKTLRLWNCITGKEMKTLKGHDAAINCISFNQDNSKLLSSSVGGEVMLWNIAGGFIDNNIQENSTDILTSFASRENFTISLYPNQKLIIRDISAQIIHSFGKTENMDKIFSIDFSPGGHLLASPESNKIKLLNVVNGQVIADMIHENVMTIGFSPDGRKLASCAKDTNIIIWEIAGCKINQILKGHQNRVYSVDFSSDSRKLASCSKDKNIILWDIATGKIEKVLKGHQDSVYSICFSPDGRKLASCSKDKRIILWDIATGKIEKVLKGHQDSVYSICFSPDGRKLASCSKDKRIILWDIATGKIEKVLKGHQDSVYSICFSPDGRKLASCSKDKRIILWDITESKIEKVLEGNGQAVVSIVFSPEGKRLASVLQDQTIKMWDVSQYKRKKELRGHNDSVLAVGFNSTGKMLASASKDKTLKLWDADSGTIVQTFEDAEGDNFPCFLDNKFLITSSDYNTIRIRDLEKGTKNEIPGKGIWKIQINRNKKIIAGSGMFRDVHLWSTENYKLKKLSGHKNYVTTTSFHPTANYLASGSWDKTIRIWDITRQKQVNISEEHTDKVYSVCYHPSGNIIASGSKDKTVRLWHLVTNKVKVLKGHTNAVTSVNFSPGGKILASGSDDKTIILWDIQTGKKIKTFTKHTHWINTVQFSPDGSLLASASGDKIIILWDVLSGKDLYSSHLSGFSYRANIPDIVVKTAFEKFPRKTSQALFQLDVKEDLSCSMFYRFSVYQNPVKPSSDIKSCFSILNSPWSQEKKQYYLCSLFLQANNLNSAYHMAKQLPKNSLLRKRTIHILQSLPDQSQKHLLQVAHLKSDQVLLMTTGAQGGSYRYLGENLQQIISDPKIILRSSHGAANNLIAVGQKKVDIGFVQHDALLLYSKSPYANIAAKAKIVASMGMEEVHILIRKNSKINTLSDLQWKKLHVGPKGSGTRLSASLILPRQVMNTAEFDQSQAHKALQRLLSGDIDAMIYTGAAPVPMFSQLPENSNIRLLSLQSSKIPEEMIKSNYQVQTLPAKIYPWQKNKITTLATPCYLVVHENISPNLVKTLFLKITREKKNFARYHPKWQNEINKKHMQKVLHKTKKYNHPVLTELLFKQDKR